MEARKCQLALSIIYSKCQRISCPGVQGSPDDTHQVEHLYWSSKDSLSVQHVFCSPQPSFPRWYATNRNLPHTRCTILTGLAIEHIGSLLRPDELVKKRYAVADKSASPDELVPVEQKAIKEVVKLEQECGIHSITNGEYSRHQFWGASVHCCRGAEQS